MKFLRIALFASLAGCSVSAAWAQYGLYGSPEMLRLPQQNTDQGYAPSAAYPTTAAAVPQPAPVRPTLHHSRSLVMRFSRNMAIPRSRRQRPCISRTSQGRNIAILAPPSGHRCGRRRWSQRRPVRRFPLRRQSPPVRRRR